MKKNPKWHRDEIILALDLYFNKNRGSIDVRNEKIAKLSATLNRLSLGVERVDQEKFRNVNGVCLKLSNFLAIDPTYSGKGMKSYSKLDRELFNKYFEDREGLKNQIDRILGTLSFY